MEYLNKKRPIISALVAFIVFVIGSLIIHQGENIIYWITMSFIMACIVGVVSLRIAVQDAKNRKEYEEIKAREEKEKQTEIEANLVENELEEKNTNN